MKALRFTWAYLLMAAFTFLTSCSSDDDEPIPEPEEEVILTPIPDGAEPGKIYAISHDKKNDVCTFQFYFGDYSTEELREKYSNVSVELRILDSAGNEVIQISGGLHSHDFDNTWEKMFRDTFEMPCYLCERIRKFEYRYFYPFDEDWTRQRKYGEETYTQLWNSPHSFTN